eukprot:155615-Prorocentrum_minimum.AAC.1
MEGPESVLESGWDALLAEGPTHASHRSRKPHSDSTGAWCLHSLVRMPTVWIKGTRIWREKAEQPALLSKPFWRTARSRGVLTK